MWARVAVGVEKATVGTSLLVHLLFTNYTLTGGGSVGGSACEFISYARP